MNIQTTKDLGDEEIGRALLDTGFSKNEAKVYVALCRLGPSSVKKIAEYAEIHRVNVYDVLKKLAKQGLAASIEERDRKKEIRLFQATDPKNVLNLLEMKKMRMLQYLDQLKVMQGSKKTKFFVSEGADAFRNYLLHNLEIGEEIMVSGASIRVFKMLTPGFVEAFHKRRIAQKQWMRHIYCRDALERVRYLNTIPYTAARCLDEKYESYVVTSICGNEVWILTFSENEEKIKPTILSIENEQIAAGFKKQFEMMWERAFVPPSDQLNAELANKNNKAKNINQIKATVHNE